jgi:glutaminyl-tRNA synthetase
MSPGKAEDNESAPGREEELQARSSNFIREIIDGHNESGRFGKRVHTRFPPVPNGYLHIGHAKSICLNFGLAAEYGGLCNLRFDDTNPAKEEEEYVESIKEDIRWLGFDWGDRLFFASDYLEKLHEWAVCSSRRGGLRGRPERRGDTGASRKLHASGKGKPFRNRSVEENLELFEKMRRGEFRDGEKVLRGEDRHGIA